MRACVYGVECGAVELARGSASCRLLLLLPTHALHHPHETATSNSIVPSPLLSQQVRKTPEGGREVGRQIFHVVALSLLIDD